MVDNCHILCLNGGDIALTVLTVHGNEQSLNLERLTGKRRQVGNGEVEAVNHQCEICLLDGGRVRCR